MHLPITAKPGALRLGVATRENLCLLKGFIHRHAAGHRGQHLLVTQRLSRLGIGWAQESSGFESGYFRGQTFDDGTLAFIGWIEHCFDSRIDAAIDHLHRPLQAQHDRVMMVGSAHSPLLLHGTDRLAGESENFQSANELFVVVAVDALRCFGIHSGELGVQRGGVESFERLARGGIVGGCVKETFEQSFEIEVGAADDDGQPASLLERGDMALCQRKPIGDGEALMGFDDVDEVVRQRGTQRGRGLGRASIEVAVDLHGIGAEDRSLGDGTGGDESLTQPDGEVAFTARGWADDDDDSLAKRGHEIVGG